MCCCFFDLGKPLSVRYGTMEMTAVIIIIIIICSE